MFNSFIAIFEDSEKTCKKRGTFCVYIIEPIP